MKASYTLIFVLMAGTAYGQSNLPACQGSDASKWSYCFGTYTETQGSWKGDKYVGEFGTLGIFHGQGTYFHLAENQWKGDKYVGQYKDGRRDGQGTYFHLAENKSKGDKYVGEYKDSKRNGQGTYFYLAENQWKGDKFVGEFKDEKADGQGTYFFLSGDKYVGEIKDGKRNGKGIYYGPNASIKASGIFKDNLLVTSQYIDPNSFTRIAKNNSAPAVSDSQQQAIEQRERQVAIEAERVAEERRRLDAEKAQIEQEKKASRIAIKGSASQPDANGDFTKQTAYQLTSKPTEPLTTNGFGCLHSSPIEESAYK